MYLTAFGHPWRPFFVVVYEFVSFWEGRDAAYANAWVQSTLYWSPDTVATCHGIAKNMRSDYRVEGVGMWKKGRSEGEESNWRSDRSHNAFLLLAIFVRGDVPRIQELLQKNELFFHFIELGCSPA